MTSRTVLPRGDTIVSADAAVVIVEEESAAAARRAAEHIAEIARQRAESGNECFLALCGGTTPAQMYRSLAAPPLSESVPWEKVRIFFGDERDVPHDHVESNYRMAQRALLDHVPIQPVRVHPMPADSDDLAGAAAQYEALIRQRVASDKRGVPRFDLVLLGMGGDGHTASLFPGTEALKESKKLVTAYHVPVLGRRRMTFTYRLINAARSVLLLVTGEDKAEAVAKLLAADPPDKSELPAAGVSPAGELIIVLDSAAAKRTDLRA